MAICSVRTNQVHPWLFPAILVAVLVTGCSGGDSTSRDDSIPDPGSAPAPIPSDPADEGAGSDNDQSTPPSTASDVIIELSWAASPDPVDGYAVYRGPTPDAATTLVTQLSVAELDNQFPSIDLNAGTDLSLSQGDEVCFWLSAYLGDQESALSEPACTEVF